MTGSNWRKEDRSKKERQRDERKKRKKERKKKKRKKERRLWKFVVHLRKKETQKADKKEEARIKSLRSTRGLVASKRIVASSKPEFYSK